MSITKTKQEAEAIKIEVKEAERPVGRVFLYIIKNDLHERPYGLLEDLYVEEAKRGQGIGKKLFLVALDEAKKYNCYKIIAQSRHERRAVHEFYKKNGLRDYGKNFRMDL